MIMFTSSWSYRSPIWHFEVQWSPLLVRHSAPNARGRSKRPSDDDDDWLWWWQLGSFGDWNNLILADPPPQFDCFTRAKAKASDNLLVSGSSESSKQPFYILVDRFFIPPYNIFNIHTHNLSIILCLFQQWVTNSDMLEHSSWQWLDNHKEAWVKVRKNLKADICSSLLAEGTVGKGSRRKQ